MAQSYDVYFARMILTLGLGEREAIQGALSAYQVMGKDIGFPRFLVEHMLMERTKVERVARELEKWFHEERARSRGPSTALRTGPGFEDGAAGGPGATMEGKPVLPTDAGASSSPDEESETPLHLTPSMPSSRPPLHVPATGERPTSRPTRSGKVVIKKAGPAETPDSIPTFAPTPAAAAPAPAAAAPPPHARESQRTKKPGKSGRNKSPSEDAHPTSKGRSGRIKTPAAPAAKPVAGGAGGRDAPHATARPKSGRHKPPSVRTAPPAKPGGQSSRRLKQEASAPAAPAAAKPQDKQWALFEKATKDQLARLVGQQLGRTEIVRLILTGEVVTSFEGKHGDDERAALVKVLRPDKVKDKVALERFTREAQALTKIDHPNIARILEAGAAEGVRYLSMDVGTGTPLATLIERSGRLPPERVAKIGRGIALGLAAAHRVGIIHRDLRPSNVLIEDQVGVKLVGFGIARDVAVPGRLTATGHVTGHPSYVAPEIAANAENSPKADVYSLGIVLYLALSGRLPFESRSVVKLIGLHLNTPPPSLGEAAPGCPAKLVALVERLLAKDPAVRPDAMEVANALAAKDLLEGFDPHAFKGEAKKPDTEEEVRRAMATDENPSVDESAEQLLGGPACAACELPLGPSPISIHGNQICAKCGERVEALELCAACFGAISPEDADSKNVAVFAGHIYCPSCTRRVRLLCTVCRKEAPLSGLATGQTKPKGDRLVHAACAR